LAKFDEIEELDTERTNPKTVNIDIMTSLEIAKLMNEEDRNIAKAVEMNLLQLSILSEKIASSINNGGRCFYVGAGTSGRVAMIDAVETVPTFNLPVGTFTTILAGGPEAMVRSLENVEDDEKGGEREILKSEVSSKDVVIGISASGRTPFVIGALKAAKNVGAFTGSVSNVNNAKLSSMVDISIEAVTGPEVVTGSTRLKAGTAQKMILNMLSTISMIRLGKVYKNLMVDVTPINEKLVIRAINIIVSATGVSKVKAEELLKISGMRPKVAIVMALTNSSVKEAEELLKRSSGNIRNTLIES
jgi:N-acetylmuramic acid 6-phosphate etherase